MRYDAKGTAVLDMVGFEIVGNVTPVEWYNHVKMENGKPDTNAITLLADIVYWYRPVEVRSELTGKVIGYEKRFKADKLQRSYGSFADQYGFSKDQVKFALARLVDLGIVDLDWRTVNYQGTLANNVLFIGLNVEALRGITHPCANQMAQGVESNGIGGRIDSHTNTETTLESTQKEPSTLSLFAQPVDDLQAPPTTSASSGKKEPKQEQPASGVLCQPDVPGSSHKEMFAALADLCKVDPNLVNGRLGAHVKSLRKAGYTVADLERFGQWWYANDFRGKRGEPPALGVVLTDLPRSVAPPPAAPQEHRYEVDTLRDWHKQWVWEEWQRGGAVELGKLPADAPAFREWYASEYGGLDEARLRQWWREQERARKGE